MNPAPSSQPSIESLRAWLRGRGLPAQGLQPLRGDVSIRLYLRADLGDGRSAILAVYPSAIRGQCRRFAASTRLLRGSGIKVPTILARDCRKGVMLLEDLGDTTLYNLARRGWRALRPLYELAADVIDRIALISPAPVSRLNPPLDATLLRAELRQTWELYLKPQGLVGNREEARALERALEALCSRLGEAPLAPCHRDLMVRNLVPLQSAPGIAVLDHQDLRLGPPFYDLACLLNDSLRAPGSLTEALLSPRLRGPADRLAYRRAAAQRLLKIVGTFEGFARRGDDRHRHLVTLSLSGALEHLLVIPETSKPLARLAERWRAHLAAEKRGRVPARSGAPDLLD